MVFFLYSKPKFKTKKSIFEPALTNQTIIIDRVLDFIAKETDGKNYKSYKYCFEAAEGFKIEYENKNGIHVIQTILNATKGKIGKGKYDKMKNKGYDIL